MLSNQKHTFHLVDQSPWPFITSIGALALTNSFVLYMHNFQYGFLCFFFSLIFVIGSMAIWWRDVIREALLEGHHTNIVQQGLKYGMILFIVSEIMFFFAFFWGFFHSSLVPTVEIGSVWPPKGIMPFDPKGVPLLNTLILLLSGATITWAHNALIVGLSKEAARSLRFTIYLAIFFTFLQGYEYIEASFNISDGVYGSTFFMATGFHGFHVLIGTTFLIVCYFRILKGHFSREHHFGFEAAAWYWHFVDVVWLFLYISIYWWGTL